MDKEKFLAWCVTKRNLVKNSIQQTRIRYDVLFRWLDGKPLTSDSSQAFILHLREKGRKNATLNSYIRVLNLIDMYEKNQNNNLDLLKNINYFPKEDSTPTFLSIAEIEAILAVKKDYSRHPYKGYKHDLDRTYRDVIWFLAGTGCRYDEMAQTKVSWLSLGIHEGFVTFPKEITKTKKARMVPLPPLLVDELKEFNKEKKPTDLVFTTSTGRKITEQTFNPELKKRVALAGINKRVHAHAFRHSYIREHRRRKTDILTLATLVGHSDPKTTLGYDRFDTEDLIKGAENHPLFSKSVAPKRLIKKVKETISQLKLDEDDRLGFTATEGTNSYSFTLFIK
jgi:integrase